MNSNDDPALLRRCQRFSLLRTALSNTPTRDLRFHNHATTRMLARLVWDHHHGIRSDPQRVDLIPLWQSLDVQGRDELVAYLREEV